MPVTNIFNGTAPVEVGGNPNLDGHILWMKTDINAGVQTFFDARTAEEGSTSITDSVGNSWTLNGTATIVPHTTIQIPGVEFVARRSNIVDYDNDGVEMPATGMTGFGAGEGNDMLIYDTDVVDPEALLWEKKLSFKSESEPDELASVVDSYLALSQSETQRYTITLDHNMSPGIDDVFIGDVVRVVIDDGYEQTDDLFWVGRKKITLSKQQDEVMTLEVTT